MSAAVSFMGQLAGVLVVGSQPMSPAAMSTGSVAAPAGAAVALAKTRNCAVTRLPRQAAMTTARPARTSGNRCLRILWRFPASTEPAGGLFARCMWLSPRPQSGASVDFDALAPDGTPHAGVKSGNPYLRDFPVNVWRDSF